MIAAEFDYAVASSVDDAISRLAEGGADAKLLAGGHSLLPLMKLRFSAPSLLVDMRKLDELRGIQTGDDSFRIGALTRHADLQAREDMGLVAAVAKKIADQQVRNRGTIGGSLSHGDSAADLPATLLAEGGPDAKLLAGGHSLLPLMKLRFAAPSLLVDMRRLDDLRGITRSNGSFSIGALTTHAAVSQAGELGVAALAASKIADQQVRNRGTIGGSLAHGDSASDMPAVLLATDGSVVARGPGGEREIAARDLFEGFLTTALAEGEIVTEVRLPAMEGYGFAYEKFTRRAEDWAMVGVCALVKVNAGQIEDARVAFTNMAAVPLRAEAVESALRGQSTEAIASAAEQAAEGTDPPGDLNATPDYKRHLARVLTRRALQSAAGV